MKSHKKHNIRHTIYFNRISKVIQQIKVFYEFVAKLNYSFYSSLGS